MRDRRKGERRKSHLALTVAERREGFDRRNARLRFLPLLREHPSWILALLVALNVMNILDLLLTLGALRQGLIEANPVMRLLFSTDRVGGVVFKIAVVASASGVMWWLRRYRATLMAVVLATCAYAALMIYELSVAAALAFAHLA